MVRVFYSGRMGNNLFQYAIGRTIAEKKGYKLIAEPINGFDRTKEVVDGKILQFNPYVTGNFGDQKLNLNAIYNHQGAIFLNGYYQQYEYIQPNKENIKSWFQFGNESWDKPHSNDLVVHIRLDDYLHIGKNYLGYDFYYNTIKSESFGNCYLLTDTPDHPDIQKLQAEGCKVFHRGQLEDLYFIKEAKKVILSHSTYSWWGVFLGNADTIHFPLMKDYNSRGLWATFGSVDLRITDNEKINYIYI